MQVIRTPAELIPADRKVCLGIGFFDGVHLGHQQIIRQTLADARRYAGTALVLTFDQHPNTIVAPTRVPSLIYPLWRKLQAIENLGVDALLLVRFDEAFSRQSGEDFIRDLSHSLPQIQSVCVGANFLFGHRRTGNVQTLKDLGATLRFTVHGLAAVSLDAKPVSSTRIREAVSKGNLDAASQMLGRAYSICGPVLHGDGLGRQLGFPTANVGVVGLVLPPHGVYAAQVRVAGAEHRAVLNIGVRPTLQNPNPELRVEAHLLDFDGDLYGQEVEVLVADHLRPERRFASTRELRDQIAQDILEAQMCF
jgi:riboflavin kinase/FMN adenylyltransferase